MDTMLSRTRWWRITPVLFITYSFAYLDRVNYSFAAAGGIGKDLGISPSTASMIGALFFLGYFAGQVPGGCTPKSTAPSAWCSGACSSGRSLGPHRSGVEHSGADGRPFPARVVEAAVFPALVIFVSRWFARRRTIAGQLVHHAETPVTVLWMSIVSGYLVQAFGWRWMFVLEGVPACLWAIGWWFLVHDRPAEAGWMRPDERSALEARIASEQGALAPVRSYREAFRSPTVVRMATLYFFWGLSLFGFVLWLPTIIKDAGSANIVRTGWLSAGPTCSPPFSCR